MSQLTKCIQLKCLSRLKQYFVLLFSSVQKCKTFNSITLFIQCIVLMCCCAPQIIPEPSLLCGPVHYPAERGHSHQGKPWKGVHALWYIAQSFTLPLPACPLPTVHPGAMCSPLLSGLVLMLIPLLSLSVVDRRQRGRPDWSAAVQPHTQQSAKHCVFWHLSIRTSINFFSNLSSNSLSVGSDHTGQPSLQELQFWRWSDPVVCPSQFGPCQICSNLFAFPLFLLLTHQLWFKIQRFNYHMQLYKYSSSEIKLQPLRWQSKR